MIVLVGFWLRNCICFFVAVMFLLAYGSLEFFVFLMLLGLPGVEPVTSIGPTNPQSWKHFIRSKNTLNMALFLDLVTRYFNKNNEWGCICIHICVDIVVVVSTTFYAIMVLYFLLIYL